jgi:hypothetical protein
MGVLMAGRMGRVEVRVEGRGGMRAVVGRRIRIVLKSRVRAWGGMWR